MPVVVVQLLSHVWHCNPTDCSLPGFPVLHCLPEFAQTQIHWVGDAIPPFHPLSPPSALTLSSEWTLRIRWPKYWSFSISASIEYSGWVSFRIDWFDLLAVQGTLKSLLQHHSSKWSILQHSVFFIIQISHPYITTGKNIASTRWTFAGKVISLLFNMLSSLVIGFLPRSKCLKFHGCSHPLQWFPKK